MPAKSIRSKGGTKSWTTRRQQKDAAKRLFGVQGNQPAAVVEPTIEDPDTRLADMIKYMSKYDEDQLLTTLADFGFEAQIYHGIE